MTPLRAKSRRIADSLVSFKGLYGRYSELAGIPPSSCMKLFHYFFVCFSIIHFFHLSVSKHPPERSRKVSKITKIYNKTSTRSSLETIPAKSSSKVLKSYPLQRFKPISKGPRYTKKHRKLDPNGPRNCNLQAKWPSKKQQKASL